MNNKNEYELLEEEIKIKGLTLWDWYVGQIITGLISQGYDPEFSYSEAIRCADIVMKLRKDRK